MAINPFFTSNYFGLEEQDLYEDLIIESIQIYGTDVQYVPRTYVALDRLYGEDMQSAFNTAYTIEMYVESIQGYEGQRDIISKFGLEIRDEIKLMVARKRFRDVVTEPSQTRPKEGDLIYIPFSKDLFEITYVQDEHVFFQAGKLYTYMISLKRFEMSGEQFNTNVPVIDSYEVQTGYSETLTLDSGFGDYDIGEMVYQGTSLASSNYKAQVKTWIESTKTLTVIRTFGVLQTGELVHGEDSGATYSIINLRQNVDKNSNDPISNNDELAQDSSETVIVERNPLLDF